MAAFILILVLLWVLAVVGVYADARQRIANDGARWLVAGFAVLFPVGGAALYLLLRPRHTLDERRHRRRLRNALEQL